jgi:hypothetical protein
LTLTDSWRRPSPEKRRQDPRFHYRSRLAYQLVDTTDDDADLLDLLHAAGEEIFDRLDREWPKMHLYGDGRIVQMSRPDLGRHDFGNDVVHPTAVDRPKWGPWVMSGSSAD